MAVDMKVAIKRASDGDDADNINQKLDNYRALLTQSDSVMKYVIKHANQVGLDLRKKR